MTHNPELTAILPSLMEMAPRLKLLRTTMPDYVDGLIRWHERAREFSNATIRPQALELDERCTREPDYFPWDLVRQAAPHRFLSMIVPSALGGGGQLTTGMAIVLEEMCAGCSGIANIFGASGLGLAGILLGLDLYHYDRAMTELVRREKCCDPILFAAAITEPAAGSDEEDADYLRTARLMTEAKPVRGGYLLNGRKVFISNGSVAEYVNVIAPLDRKRPVETHTGFLVKRGDAGFSVGRIEKKMGMKACPAAELIFEDCFVPTCNRVGPEGDAVRGIETVLGASRGPVGAIATGTARGAFERAYLWAKTTKQGGRWLLDRQWVRLKLAEMNREIHVARQSYLDACLHFDFFGAPKLMRSVPSRVALDWLPAFVRKSPPVTRALRSESSERVLSASREKLIEIDDLSQIQALASTAKVSASDMAVRVAFDALQLVGLPAVLNGHGLEKIFRDAKLTQIYEGTNELNRHNIFVHRFGQEQRHAS